MTVQKLQSRKVLSHYENAQPVKEGCRKLLILWGKLSNYIFDVMSTDRVKTTVHKKKLKGSNSQDKQFLISMFHRRFP